MATSWSHCLWQRQLERVFWQPVLASEPWQRELQFWLRVALLWRQPVWPQHWCLYRQASTPGRMSPTATTYGHLRRHSVEFVRNR